MLEVHKSCDVCGAPGLTDGTGQSVRIALRGRTVTVDLCAEHADAVDRALEPILDAGEARSRRTAAAGRSSVAFPRLRPGEDREHIRGWALAQGLPVARSGTISGAVLESWRSARAGPAISTE